MPGQKISSLTPVSDLQAADQLPLARSGSTYKITGDKFASKAQLDALSATSAGSFALKTDLLSLSANPFIAADTSTIDLTLTNRTLFATVFNNSVTNSKLAFDGGSFAFRNKIINGGFDIWQRGTSLTSAAGARYLADRFTNGSAGTTCTAAQSAFALGQTDVPNEPNYYISTAVTSVAGASNNATLHQHIESVKSCAGKTVTLSFYAKSNASRNVAVELYQNFGTGGTPSTSVSIPAGLFALTTSWQKFTVTVNIPSISGKTLGTAGNDSLVVYFWFDAGSSNSSRASSLGQQSGTFDIARVQLEEGPTATPFEHRPIGTELALCQRYFEKSYPTNVAPGTAAVSTTLTFVSNTFASNTNVLFWDKHSFNVSKRSTPAMNIYSNVTGTIGSYRAVQSAPVSISVDVNIVSSGGGVVSSTGGFALNGGYQNLGSNGWGYTGSYHYTADAEL